MFEVSVIHSFVTKTISCFTKRTKASDTVILSCKGHPTHGIQMYNTTRTGDQKQKKEPLVLLLRVNGIVISSSQAITYSLDVSSASSLIPTSDSPVEEACWGNSRVDPGAIRTGHTRPSCLLCPLTLTGHLPTHPP